MASKTKTTTNGIETYTTDEGILVSPDLSRERWEEATDWDGSNHVSRATGSQWDHERLFRGSDGRYWVLSWSQRDGCLDTARYVSDKQAAQWLVRNRHLLPSDLAHLIGEVVR